MTFKILCSKFSKASLAKLRRENKGVAAIEFAIVAPILMLLFLGTIEVSLAVAVDRKVSRASSAIADLVTQTTDREFNEDYLDAISDIAERIIFPYNKNMDIILSGVSIANGTATVEWSWAKGQFEKLATGSTITVPSTIRIDGTFLVTAEVQTEHEPVFGFITLKDKVLSFDTESITVAEQMFLRPRNFNDLVCENC